MKQRKRAPIFVLDTPIHFPWVLGGTKTHLSNSYGDPLCNRNVAGIPGETVDSAWLERHGDEPDYCRLCVSKAKAIIADEQNSTKRK